jgi:hypothetical protein
MEFPKLPPAGTPGEKSAPVMIFCFCFGWAVLSGIGYAIAYLTHTYRPFTALVSFLGL